jgi:hypothetical protein
VPLRLVGSEMCIRDSHNTKHFYSIMPENSRVKIEIEKGLMELIE